MKAGRLSCIAVIALAYRHSRKSCWFQHNIGSKEMEGSSSRAPEITIVPAPRPAAGGGAVDAVKAASKEPISPGSPSPLAAVRSKGEGAVSLPGWKLDSLCKESGSPPAMIARFPYF